MLIVGCTGGIGSGKSTVTRLFAALEVPVIDADLVARQVVEPGQPALQEIAEQFGPGVIDAQGELKRAKLREIIFQHPEQRRKLEAILHPRIRHTMAQQARQLPPNTPYCIFSIPLLLESGQQQDVDRILVVDAPPQLQLERTCQRDDISPAQAQAIIDSQVSRQQRLAEADDVIGNQGDLASLQAQVAALHQKYLQLAK